MGKRPDIVLVVDDNPTNLDLLSQYLTRSGFYVVTATNGLTAIEMAKKLQPNIILLDIMMPEVNGFEACRRLKNLEETKQIPVIIMTALTDIDNKMKAFTAGAVDYVTKPFEQREVLARLNTHLTLRHLQEKLEEEIVEREKVEAKLRDYTAELQAKNEELDAFAHTVAHNLKNPLNALTGISYLLSLDYATISLDEAKKYLHIIHRSGRKALSITGELLVLASVRQQDINLAPLDMGQITYEALQRVENIIEEFNAEIILPENWPVAWGHAPWVEEIWANYISNATKYGGSPPRIELGATSLNDHWVKFWVKDNGNGLTPAEQQLLFTPFTQLNKIQAKGHGLGLSIVRRIAEKLGGQVGVESSAQPGQGSVFTFTLPIIDSTTPAPSAP